jgi:hypothetical protein
MAGETPALPKSLHQHALGAAEKLQFCHSEGGFCPRNLLFSWDLRKSRSLAALGMTTKSTFSAACLARRKKAAN